MLEVVIKNVFKLKFYLPILYQVTKIYNMAISTDVAPFFVNLIPFEHM